MSSSDPGAILREEGTAPWAIHALNVTRGALGMEQATELLMQLVYLRWGADSAEHRRGRWSWDDLVAQATDKTSEAEAELLRAELSKYFGDLRETALPLDDDDGITLGAAMTLVDRTFFELAGEELREACHGAFEEVLRVRTRELSRVTGELATPESIAQLMCGLVDMENGRVLDPACGLGTALLAAAYQGGASDLVGFDISGAATSRVEMRFDLAGIWADLKVRDALVEPWGGDFAAIVLQPPFSQRLSEAQVNQLPALPFGPSPRSSSEFAWLQLACQALSPDGRAVMLSAQRPLFHAGAEAHVRENLLGAGLIEAVIALPPSLFSHTTIPTVLWLLRSVATEAAYPPPVLLVNAQPLGVSTGRLGQTDLPRDAIEHLVALVRGWRATPHALEAPAHLARAVPVSELIVSKTLLPQQYLKPPPLERSAQPVPPQMLLTQVRLGNFKSFGSRRRIEVAPINLIYGPNSAGKSSFLQSLLVLKQSMTSANLVTQGRHADAGTFLGAVHNHDADAEMEIGFTFGALRSWDVPGGTPNPGLLRSVDIGFRMDASGLPQKTRVQIGIGDDLAVSFVPHSVFLERDDAGFSLSLQEAETLFMGLAEGTLLWPFDTRHGSETDDDDKKLYGRQSNVRRALRLLEEVDVDAFELDGDGLLPGRTVHLDDVLVRLAGSERERGMVRSYAQRAAQLVGAVGFEARLLLEGLAHLGPFRPPPQRFYNRLSATTSGERTALHLFDNSSDVEEVNTWLRQLGVPYNLAVVPVSTASHSSVVGDLVAMVLSDLRTGIEVSPVDVGFGISQLLPIVVELLARQNSIVFIEQPETHLHPKLQTELADLLIHSALTPGRENQLFVETHSEHILMRLQRRMGEGVITPDDVAVLYIDHDDSGEAVVRRLPLDPQGHFLEPWPAGFFDEALDELFGDLL